MSDSFALALGIDQFGQIQPTIAEKASEQAGPGDIARAVADPVVLHSLKCELISALARCSHFCASIKYLELCTGLNTAN